MAEEQGHAGGSQPGASNAGPTSLAVRSGLVARRLLWRPHDPGSAALRRALRAAIVIPLALAFALLVIQHAQTTIYVALGSFALLVLADFGDLRRPRASAYLGTTLVGVVLVALGTLFSFSPWVGASAMLVVGFVLSFASGVFGGYIASAESALLLIFVLSVAVPAPPTAIPTRVLGWSIAGVVSTLASVLLWPQFERSTMRSQAAAACRALAALLRATWVGPEAPDLADVQQAAATAVQAVVQAYAATPSHPAGPAQRDSAFASLLSKLERILGYVTRPVTWSLSEQHPGLVDGDVLAAETAQALEASGNVLVGGTPPDLVGLQAARLANRLALDRWAADALQAGVLPEEVLAGFDAGNLQHVVTLLVLALGADALLAMGHSLPDQLQLPLAIPREAGAVGIARRVGETVRTHLHPSSSVLQNSLRIAMGLALAVLLGGLLQVEHAFWVVLGTLSALRSSALATGRTTMQVLAGTAIGVAIGAPLISLVGADRLVLWVVYPIAIFFAAYAASVIGFVAGQAAFTLLILTVFNLLAPSGWTLGLVRLEDVALGVGISVVVGLLLWPRGLRAELRRALADLYHAVADDLAAAFNQILGLGTTEAFLRAQGRAMRAAVREGEAFDQYVRERASRPLAPQIASALGVAGRSALVVGDHLHGLADRGYRAQLQTPADGEAPLLGQVHALTATYVQVGNQLAQAQATTEQQVNEAVLQAAMLDALRRWKEDPAAEQTAVAIIAGGLWIRDLADLAANQEEAARMPWWRVMVPCKYAVRSL